MATTIKPGARLLSAVCTTEMITVNAPVGEVELTIGGVPPERHRRDEYRPGRSRNV